MPSFAFSLCLTPEPGTQQNRTESGSAAATMRSNVPFFMLATFMVSSVDGHAVIMNTQCDRLNACAVGTCATIMGMTPTTGGSLSISGLTNGGTYTPGGTYGLSFSGSGERIFYTTAGSLSGLFSGDTGCGAL